MTRGRLAPLRHPEVFHKENRRISETARSGFGGMFAQTFLKEK
jgi:hypothetical protein